VKVLLDPGAAGTAEVVADVEAVRVAVLGEHAHAEADELTHLGECLGREFGELTRVLVRGD